jgi:UbiD family decarboxylase
MADLRDWIQRVDAVGELRRVRGATWQEDIGAVAELLDHADGSPCVLFDDIPGYPAGRRVLVNCNGTPVRQALTLGLDPRQGTHQGLLDFWRRTLADLEPVEPVEVANAPVLEHTVEGAEVDLEAFPAPVWHPRDGGRYLATASLTVLRHPDTAALNAGTYRGQVLARDELGIYTSPGHHGRAILQRYAELGEPCPVVTVLGGDPLEFMAACVEGIAEGENELAWAGGVRDRAVEVVKGPHTGLPIPASAEVAVEGFVDPRERREEGPYGEWHGYYSRQSAPAPFVRVVAIHHRSDPIVMGCPQGRPPHEDNRFLAYLKSALAERQLRDAGVPHVTAVWCPPELGNRLLVVVAVKISYPGHATQAGLVAGQVGATAYGGRLVVVVDEDVDVTDLDEVLWALATRCDPRRDTQVVDRAWSSALDVALPPDAGGLNSRLILDATRPWEWRTSFPEPVVTTAEARATRERWGWLLAQPTEPRPERPTDPHPDTP